MAFSKNFVYVAVLLSVSVCAGKLPDFLKLCSRNDPKLKECIIKNGNEAIPQLVKGYKSLKIPALNPLKISFLEVQTGPNLKLSLKNITVHGFDTMVLTDMNIDIANRKGQLRLHGKEFELDGIYDITGQILILPITGSGPANIKMANADFDFYFEWNLVEKDGISYTIISNEKLNYTSGGSSYKLDNLFNGNKALGDQMNNFLNENWKEVSTDLAPSISETIKIIVHKIVQAIADIVPFDDILTM